MPTVAHKVAPDGEKWLVTRDGEPGMSYVSQEAASEVATAEAAGDLRTGNEIRIEVLGSAYSALATVLLLPWTWESRHLDGSSTDLVPLGLRSLNQIRQLSLQNRTLDLILGISFAPQ